MELNQRYESGAVVPDATAGTEEWPRHRELYLQARTRPGAKLPHAWLVGSDGIRVSTLDVVGKGQMTLLTGLAGQAWKRAAQKLDLPFLRTVVVGEPGTIDPYGYWHRVREIDEAGAILVRPDGYVAWRQSAAVWDDAEALHQLEDALTAVLGRPVSTQSGKQTDTPEYSTQAVPITVPMAMPADRDDTEHATGGAR
ncbi:aromatic-ring hydroxylase C-terminal domain-containing protein [Blastococcus sp. PRF04-17]|uniref:aromatic-ring hydroxylase C-terminal domain-containing protein n=1 Tax=Blastococcus sp. PRF04-17 TaxID=2933797 RepID=UPI0035300572